MNRQAVTYDAAAKVNLKAGQLAPDGADYKIDVAAIGGVTPAQMAAADAVVEADAAADATAKANAAQATAIATAAADATSKANAAQAASQPLNANLTAESGLTGTADKLSYFTGVGAKALATFTSFGRSLVAAAAAADAKTLLSLVKGDVGLGNVDNTSDANKPVSTQQAAADALRMLKAGDTMTGLLAVVNTAVDTLISVTAKGIGELPVKIRSNASSTTSGAQAGMDFGFSDFVRVTFATASTTGVGAIFNGTAYFFAQGMSGGLRFITSNGTPISFAPNQAVKAQVAADGTLQAGGAFTGGDTLSIPFYAGASGGTVQMRLGDTSGYSWQFGRDNVSSGDLGVSVRDGGVTRLPAALAIAWADGIARVSYGLKVGVSGTAMTQVKVYTPTLTPTAIAGAGLSVQTFTVTGLATTDTISVNGPAAAATSQLVHWRVSASDTLELTWYASAPVTPTSGTYRVLAVRT